MAATVTELTPRTRTGRRERRPVTVGESIEEFLASPRCNESPHTQRAYTNVLYRVADRLDPTQHLAEVDDDEIGTAVTTLWGHSGANHLQPQPRRHRLLADLVRYQSQMGRPGTAGHVRTPQTTRRQHPRRQPHEDRPDVQPPRRTAARETALADALRGVQPRYGQKPPSVDRGVSFCCSDEVLALVVKAAVEAEHREVVPT
jgi:hypothetical protein